MKAAPQRPSPISRPNSDEVVVTPEAHLVAWLDGEFIAKFLRDADLAFWPHSMNHTDEYDFRFRARRGDDGPL